MRYLFLLILLHSSLAAQIPDNCRQVIVGITDDWESSHVQLTTFEKDSVNKWQSTNSTWNGRVGRNGLAWGLGLHKGAQKGLIKKEGDGRAPAGIFKLGGAYGYAKCIQKNTKLEYRKITTKDLWVEDSKSELYNSHVVLKKEPSTVFEKRAQMRQNDSAHSLKLFVAHNAATKSKPAKQGAGSAIFFHIWRANGAKSTAGCTTMSERLLKKLIASIDPSRKPVYVLLPRAEYDRLRSAWKLP